MKNYLPIMLLACFLTVSLSCVVGNNNGTSCADSQCASCTTGIHQCNYCCTNYTVQGSGCSYCYNSNCAVCGLSGATAICIQCNTGYGLKHPSLQTCSSCSNSTAYNCRSINSCLPSSCV